VQPPAGSQVSWVPTQRSPHDPAGPAPAPVPPPPPPGRRWGRIFAVLGGVLALLCLGGATVGFLLYDRATAPDRSAPDVVVDNYLRAFLVDRNDTRADLFTCGNNPDLAAVKRLREEVVQREAKFNVTVRITWGALSQAKTQGGESVRTTLTIAGFANGESRSSRREEWQFDVVEDPDGWRVCRGQKAT
jgi:hypothetical protein